MKSFTYKKLFLEISQNSQENICTRVSFLIKLQPLGLLLVLLNSFTCRHFDCPESWGKWQITELRKADDCCIFHSSFFIDFCHTTHRNQVFSTLEHALPQFSKVINMNFAFGKLDRLTTQLLLHGTTHFILRDIA